MKVFQPIISGSLIVTGSTKITGSLGVTDGITGRLYGTSSWAEFVVNGSGGAGSKIITGSVEAAVNTTPENLFLIKSAGTEYLNISASSNAELYSNLFIVKNFNTKQPVLTISQSIVQFATHSADPTGTTQAGSVWFTSTDLYVGLEGN